MTRTSPNIVITGTPGVGKTSHCEVLAEKTGLKHLSVNQIVKEKECHEGWDEKYQSWVVDEDKVCLRIYPSHPILWDWFAKTAANSYWTPWRTRSKRAAA